MKSSQLATQLVEGYIINSTRNNSLNGPCGIVVLIETVIEPLSSKNSVSSKTTLLNINDF